LALWACSTLSAHGIDRVETAVSVEAWKYGLDGYDGVFLGGGNTYMLLNRLRSTGMGLRLAQSIREGLPCYGGSAGAIVLGAHIGSCAHLDCDDVGMTDLAGLDLFDGRAVWCHYQPADADGIRALAREAGLDVLAIAENAAVAFDGTELRGIGPGRAEVWTAEGPLSNGGLTRR
jgi:dipeptidase E